MSRRRYSKRPAPRRRYYDDDDYASYRPRRRRGCLAPIKQFFRNVAIILLVAIGAIVFFLIVLLIAFNFAIFVQILLYALLIAAGLAALGLLYLVVRMITAISGRISAASVARSKARIERERANIERERVGQARVQIQAQEAKLYQQERLFNQKYLREAERDYYAGLRPSRDEEFYQSPKRTRNFREESPYRTKILAQQLAESAYEPEEPEESEAELTELEALGMPSKGQIFTYRDYKRFLKRGQLLIGVRGDGSVKVGTWQDFKILLILGSSSSGKSTTVLEKAMCIVEDGGQLIICDPGGAKPDALTQRIGPLASAIMPGTIIALEHEDILKNVQVFDQELERRRRGASIATPVLLVIDELNSILLDKTVKKELAILIEKLAIQARGYNMYMILCAQRVSGLASIRSSVISTMVHKCPQIESSKVLPASHAKLTPQLGVGQTFVIDFDGEIHSLQQCLITRKDVEERMVQRRSRTIPSETALTGFYTSETEPIDPPQNAFRQYGAVASSHLQRTHLVSQGQQEEEEEEGFVPHPPPPTAAPKTPRRASSNASATWGEQVPPQPASPRRTTQPVKLPVPRRQTAPTTDDLSGAIDQFDALAALRDQEEQRRKQQRR